MGLVDSQHPLIGIRLFNLSLRHWLCNLLGDSSSVQSVYMWQGLCPMCLRSPKIPDGLEPAA